MSKILPVVVACLLATTMGASASSIPEKASVCSGCHGQDGMGQPNIAPMIAGLNANYLNTQIELFLSGERQNVVMQGMAKELSDPAD
ncbi:cystathionine beta-synthase, partial [Vibrio parahaemolyticus]|nr:cystathionine beta-synthase [Vibrio parahaemolyticus]